MRNDELFARARALMPGGVSSPVRAFGSVGGTPRFVRSGAGARIVDEDGVEYIDLLGSWGPLILGHAHSDVVAAIGRAARAGTSFGAPTEGEITLAELICEAIGSIEMVRFVSSGTEAAMSAIRLARAATGRSKVLKFAGCYHGHSDGLLVSAGSGALTLALPDSPGVPASIASETIVVPYNDARAVAGAFARFGSDIACAIVEPVAANMGVVPPVAGFLEAVRARTSDAGSLLIFDEVVTGFRVGRQGAQGMFGVRPDLTVLGKVIGGGLPIGAYGGARALMERIAPSGPVYQAGTLSGNPVSVAAGIATLRALDGDAYTRLDALGARLAAGLEEAAKSAGTPLRAQRVGSMMTPFFTDRNVTDLAGATNADAARYARFFHGMLARGVMLPPSPFEAAFVSLAHTEADVDTVIAAARDSLKEH